jgi:hypothetical protein
MDPTAPEKKGSRHNPQLGWVIHRFTTQFLSQHSHWSSNERQISVDSRLLGLLGPYHQYAIGTFNTCSRVSTPRSLTNTGGGYHIENVGIVIALSPPFPSKGFTDPSNGPAQSQIIQQHLPKELKRRTSPKSREWEPPLDFYCNLPSTHGMS